MNHTEELIISRVDWEALRQCLAQSGSALALLGNSRSPGQQRWLVAELLPQTISLNKLRLRCRAERMGLLELHAFGVQEAGLRRLESRAGSVPGVPCLSVEAGTSLCAWRWDPQCRTPQPLAAVRLIGVSEHSNQPAVETCDQATQTVTLPGERLQRQLPVLGVEQQRRLAAATVAVVGCGGNGSHLAQLLALAGVGHLLLIDDDRIEESNRNRLVAASDGDVQRRTYKAIALRRHLARLTPDVQVRALPRTLYHRSSINAVLAADLLVGCTDNEGSRLHMNHLAVQHLLPYVDCGVGIERSQGRIIGGGQVRVVLPGGPCLECYGGIQLWRASSDLGAPRERAWRVAHGYGSAGELAAPAVPVLNAVIAAETAASVLALLTGLRPIAPYLAYDFVRATLQPRADIVRNPACQTCAPGQRYGRGSTLPLPTPRHEYAMIVPLAPSVSGAAHCL